MPWFAIHTRSRHEDKVNNGLTQKAFHVFLPKMEVWSSRKDRRKKIFLPMFPGYIFIELTTTDPETRVDVLKTFGVVRILTRPHSSEPASIPDDKIEAIQRITQSKVEVQQLQYPKVGEKARIVDGPFKGIEGEVIETDYQKELFVVTIDLLQRSVAIKLEGFRIEKA